MTRIPLPKMPYKPVPMAAFFALLGLIYAASCGILLLVVC